MLPWSRRLSCGWRELCRSCAVSRAAALLEYAEAHWPADARYAVRQRDTYDSREAAQSHLARCLRDCPLGERPRAWVVPRVHRQAGGVLEVRWGITAIAIRGSRGAAYAGGVGGDYRETDRAGALDAACDAEMARTIACTDLLRGGRIDTAGMLLIRLYGCRDVITLGGAALPWVGAVQAARWVRERRAAARGDDGVCPHCDLDLDYTGVERIYTHVESGVEVCRTRREPRTLGYIARLHELQLEEGTPPRAPTPHQRR